MRVFFSCCTEKKMPLTDIDQHWKKYNSQIICNHRKSARGRGNSRSASAAGSARMTRGLVTVVT